MTRPRRDECLNTDTATTPRPSAAASSRTPGSRGRIARPCAPFVRLGCFLFDRGNEVHFLSSSSPPAPRRRLASVALPATRPQSPCLLSATSTFSGTTYATRHIITTTIPNAAEAGRTRSLGDDWTTNHRPSAMANDMSLLSISLSGSEEPRDVRGSSRTKISTLAYLRSRNRAPSRLRIHPGFIGITIGAKAAGPSSRSDPPRTAQLVVPTRKLGDDERTRRRHEEREEKSVAPVRC